MTYFVKSITYFAQIGTISAAALLLLSQQHPADLAGRNRESARPVAQQQQYSMPLSQSVSQLIENARRRGALCLCCQSSALLSIRTTQKREIGRLEMRSFALACRASLSSPSLSSSGSVNWTRHPAAI
ncbi:gelsolin repeat protein [Pseudozyma hubeiensis SY62]|uniref:Gelsolin repeat protein n=1 Tax=Pseudozyma hubeiensis (strain SY62) TaxID=1305764 RepID=R9NX67_PSEHS|nr:gelsolin repeat protein [Pseudozyma hubeiensis SY62]GAC93243.1 gelsolin repeat protein [Pseudozyma hubeiensis SY62]